MTCTVTLLFFEEIIEIRFDCFLKLSISIPKNCKPWQIRSRISGDCSPMPPANTSVYPNLPAQQHKHQCIFLPGNKKVQPLRQHGCQCADPAIIAACRYLFRIHPASPDSMINKLVKLVPASSFSDCIKYHATPGSISPVRVLIGKPDAGVKPILVSMLFSFFTAAILAPLPRCANIILLLAAVCTGTF